MKNLVIIASLLTFSSSLAAPLMGSKSSVNESNFCKKYKCVFIASAPYNPSRDPSRFKGYKQFTYRLSGMGILEIVRNQSNTIESADIKFDGVEEFRWAYKNDGMYTKDFALSFLGAKISNSLSSACLDDVTAEDTPPIAAGLIAQNGRYVFKCLASVAMEGAPTKTAIFMTIGLK